MPIASEDVEWLDEDAVDTTGQSDCFFHRRLHHLQACQLFRTVRSRYCTVEANYTDGHKARRLSATAELLVNAYVYMTANL